ncbi:LOW QUALITY PROTEIN: hypothetical protein M8C21_006917, partial [Ambrosia artemisiifolia]
TSQVLENTPILTRPDYPDPFSSTPISHIHTQTNPLHIIKQHDDLWLRMKDEAISDVTNEPILKNYYFSLILSHNVIETALAAHLSIKLGTLSLSSDTLYDLFVSVLKDDQDIVAAVKHDLWAVKERDPACVSYVQCFLNFKGFLAVQAHRIAHKLWSQDRKILAVIIQNRVSEVFALDIHPGARIGYGILFDHATGLVIGETAFGFPLFQTIFSFLFMLLVIKMLNRSRTNRSPLNLPPGPRKLPLIGNIIDVHFRIILWGTWQRNMDR